MVQKKDTIFKKILHYRILPDGKTEQLYLCLKGDEEKEMVCGKILWIPYDLVALEELLRDNQYPSDRRALKGLKRKAKIS